MKGWIRPKLGARSSAVVRCIELTNYSESAEFLPFFCTFYTAEFNFYGITITI